MVTGNTTGKTSRSIRATGSITILKERVNIVGQTDDLTKVTGKIMSCTVMVNSLWPMVAHMWVNIKMIKSKD